MSAAGVSDVWNHNSRFRWVCALMCCAGMMMTLVSQSRASEMAFGGRVTISGRQTESEIGANSEQLGLTTTIDGKGYIWRPWYATLSLKLDLSQTSSEVEQNEGGPKQESQYKLVSGDGKLKLFPQSRFPLEASVNMFDSRIETDKVGVPLEDINTLRRERFGVIQRYRTVRGHSNFTFQLFRTRVLENDTAEEVIEYGVVSGSHRFDTQSLDYDIRRQETVREENFEGHSDRQGVVNLRHGYRPDPSFNLDSSISLVHEEERFYSPGGLSDPSLLDRSSQGDTRSAATFMTWRPSKSKWSMRANMGVRGHQQTTGSLESEDRSSNASAGVAYSITDNLRLNGNAGISRTSIPGQAETDRNFQDAALEYTPAQIPLGAVQYHWHARSAISNTDTNTEPSVQTGSLDIFHGIEKFISNEEGRTLSFSVNQGATKYLTSEGRNLLTISHSSSVGANWRGVKTTNRVQLNLEDTRTSGVEPDPQDGPELKVERISQRANVISGHQSRITRSSSLDGDISISITRAIDQGQESRVEFARASAGYTYTHLFRVEQLRFRSRIEYSFQQSESELQQVTEESDERRASWDSRLDYTIGLLSLSLRRTQTAIDGQETVTLVMSASRRF